MTTDARTIIEVIAEEVQHLGFSEVARRSGYDRGTLYHAFGSGASRTVASPRFTLLCDVAEAVGMTIQVVRR